MKKKILIVEDEFVVANDLQIMLEASGYEVCGMAVSANAALEEMEKVSPDLVLLDIQLQGARSGIDLARQLKTMNIAFVYLSANSDRATLQKARATEPYGFLVKPVRARDLAVTLDIACYRHEHSLESFLFRRDRLRRDLIHLTGEPFEAGRTLCRFAESLQMVVPFDLLCFAYTTAGAGHQFAGLLRSGYNEYQEMDKAGLMTITARSESEIDALLSPFLPTPEMQAFTGKQYPLFLKEDALAEMLNRSYLFQAAIRGVIELPALSNCKMYIFSGAAEKFEEKHLSALEGMQNLIGKLVIRLEQREEIAARRMPKDDCDTTPSTFGKFIGKSKAISQCLDLVAQVAPLNTSVLLIGESGTGKELFAEAIHELSQRNKQPLIKINCAALPPTLIESELFGYEKGAFTGAMTSRVGIFEAASGGTIFLDEIGEMGLEVQAKLLRVLQEKMVQRVGGRKMITTDVRIIAATNRDLEKAVAERLFRLDLYFRLNVFPIQLPPLRQRKEDIVLLAGHLGRRIARSMGREYCGMTDTMMEALKQYDWPGNVRELENVVERAMILSGVNKPMTWMLPFGPAAAPEPLGGIDGFSTIDEIKQRQEQCEIELIEAALRASKGKIRGPGGAAEKLDIKPSTLESKLLRFGIQKDSYK